MNISLSYRICFFLFIVFLVLIAGTAGTLIKPKRIRRKCNLSAGVDIDVPMHTWAICVLFVIPILTLLFFFILPDNFWFILFIGGCGNFIFGCIYTSIRWKQCSDDMIYQLVNKAIQKKKDRDQAREARKKEFRVLVLSKMDQEARTRVLVDENINLVEELTRLLQKDAKDRSTLGGFGSKSRIREIGKKLNTEGGIELMRAVYYAVKSSGPYFSQDIWDGIGDWQA
jgi:hypothetical protein